MHDVVTDVRDCQHLGRKPERALALLALLTPLGCSAEGLEGSEHDGGIDGASTEEFSPEVFQGDVSLADQGPSFDSYPDRGPIELAAMDQSVLRDQSVSEGLSDGTFGLDHAPRDTTVAETMVSDTAPVDPRAWLHADVWSVFWNDRTRCGAERTFVEICEGSGGDCGSYRAALSACDPSAVIYGQVGPSRQGERLCQRGRFPEIGGCDARRYDFSRLRFYWYGAEWQGNWPFATLKVFPAGTRDTRSLLGPGLVAFSNLPNTRQSAMEGIANHGLDRDGDGRPDRGACVMPGVSTGDAAYRSPFGGFAWIEVPTGRAVTVVVATGTNFADRGFEGCSRGAATQSPWISGAPGATLGCVYLLDQEFRPGTHYVFRYGRIEVLPGHGPPPEIISGFMLPEVSRDVRDGTACAR